MNKREQGALYEEYAAKFLSEQGYIIVTKNYFTKFGEIDLIAEKENLIIFIEVKQRTTDFFGRGEQAIGYTKRKRMYLSAREFLFKNRYSECDIRFDAVVFNGRNTKPEWIKNIIWGDEFGF